MSAARQRVASMTPVPRRCRRRSGRLHRPDSRPSCRGSAAHAASLAPPSSFRRGRECRSGRSPDAIPFRKSDTASSAYGVPIRNPTTETPSTAVTARRLHRPDSTHASSGAATIGSALYLLVTASPAARPASAARLAVGFSMTRSDSQTHNRQNAAISVSTATRDDSVITKGVQATSSAASTAGHGDATTRRVIPYVARIINRLKTVPTDSSPHDDARVRRRPENTVRIVLVTADNLLRSG